MITSVFDIISDAENRFQILVMAVWSQSEVRLALANQRVRLKQQFKNGPDSDPNSVGINVSGRIQVKRFPCSSNLIKMHR